MAAGTLIELDVDPVAGAEREPGLPPGWRRVTWIAFLAVACVASLVAAQPLQPARLVPVGSLNTAPMLSERVAGDMMYAIVSDTPVSLDAYRLSDAALRWRIPLPIGDSAASVEVSPAFPSTVLVNSMDPTTRGDRTAAVDASTGRLLWHSRSFRVTQINSGATTLLADDVGTGRRYRQVDARTGRELWSYEVPTGWTTALPDDPPGTDTERHLVAVSPTGAARSLELATGRQVAAAEVEVGGQAAAEAGDPAGPGLDRDPSFNDGPSLMIRGDELLVGYQDATTGQASLAGYRTDTLGPLWTIPVQSLTLRVDGCGVLLCLGESGRVRALRADTGAVVWTGKGWPGVVGVLGHWLYTVSDLAASYGYWPGPARLIDPRTGRTDLDLGKWRLVSEPDPAGRPALFELIESGTGRVWLGTLGTGPSVQPLGTIADLPSGTCDAGPAYIVCLTTGQLVSIWRYRT
jgi:outer membrane protein assembly factor BamB